MAQYYETFYGRNLRMFIISLSVCPLQAFAAKCSKCLWLRPGANPLAEHLKGLCVSATKTINKKIVNIVKIVKICTKSSVN
jgi:hypothetical protein